MESYEEFCLRSVAALQEEGNFKAATCEPMVTYSSAIVICGKAALSPLLDAEQRQHMRHLKRGAVQLERQQRSKPSAQVSDKARHQVPSGEAEKSHIPKETALNSYTLITDSPILPLEARVDLQTVSRPTDPLLNGLLAEEEKSDEEDMSPDSLLKQTQEHVKRELSREGSKGVVPTPSPEPVSEGEMFSPNRGTELGRGPVSPPEIALHQNVSDPKPQESASPPGPAGQCLWRPSPESGLGLRKPRPFSTGSLRVVFPGMPGECAALSERRKVPPGASWSPDRWSSASSGDADRRNTRGSHRSGCHCAISPMRETCGPGPIGLSSTSRGVCQTVDTQLRSDPAGLDNIDRSQERTARFIAGVTVRPSSWYNSNKSFQGENLSPHRPMPRVSLAVNLGEEPDDPRGPCYKTGTAFLRQAGDVHATNTEEAWRRARVLEEMQRRLEEEHASQISLLLAQQEKEQQCLRREFEEAERRLSQQARAKLQTAANDGAVNPTAATPGCCQGFPSPVTSNKTFPSPQSPIYLRGPLWSVHKPQARPSQILEAEQGRVLFRIGAVARGFLVRRLLKTHKIQHLCQTVTDTRDFIRSFQTAGPQKRSPFSAQDLSLQDRVRAQLRAALYDIHEIFFEMPPADRWALLQQDRELCAEKKQRDTEKAKKERERTALSATTQRSLDRKKREGQATKVMQKPKSPTPVGSCKVQKPSQVQKGVPSQLKRQGSWYTKTPEARVQRLDNLKKQQSLG
ncbi:uncharacterized protein [Syngnathus scovelli]|uniref:uncharacterized protein isoform X2 n=1 Tax=Syngnathus scovelli TaxID=161590 RepID=UPI00210F40C3|nr:uncharacterized protein LOC125983641 isoform X2 [Syngnathus scovelli]